MMPKGRGVLCPSCRVQVIIPNGRNAISRRDNKTEICSRCGQLEAVSEYLVYTHERRRTVDPQYQIELSEMIRKRDRISQDEAYDLVEEALDAIYEALDEYRMEDVEGILMDYLGLEPDYLDKIFMVDSIGWGSLCE